VKKKKRGLNTCLVL